MSNLAESSSPARNDLVTVGPISGFPEFNPGEQLAFDRVVSIIREHYAMSGAVPIETPAFERRDVLLAMQSDETAKQIYGVRRLVAGDDDSDTALALRFDLTVPFARYVAMRHAQLIFPFKRYQIQPVWRGERAQKGRYRQFYQADIDIVGDGALDILHDAEPAAIISRIFTDIGVGPFVIRINNRKLLQGIAVAHGIQNEGGLAQALRIIDSLEKIGHTAVIDRLAAEVALSSEQASRLVKFIASGGDDDAKLSSLRALDANKLVDEGMHDLREVLAAIHQLGVSPEKFRIDLSIARGLDYYTGTVYETTLTDFPRLGSVCSGGRYDNLASAFTTRKLPGVGISIGVTRLVRQLIDAGILAADQSATAEILVTMQDQALSPVYLALTARLREAGLSTEVYLQRSDNLRKQLAYANRRGFRLVVIAGANELDQAGKGTVRLRDMHEHAEQTVEIDDLVTSALELLGKRKE